MVRAIVWGILLIVSFQASAQDVHGGGFWTYICNHSGRLGGSAICPKHKEPQVPEVLAPTNCSLANGKGQWSSPKTHGPCLVQTCSSGYKIVGNSCKFIPISRSCSIANGSGTQINTGAGFGACTITSCNAGYRIENNQCILSLVAKSCSIANGIGQQIDSGPCLVQSCNSGYQVVGNSCQPNPAPVSTRACNIYGGTGTQSFLGGAWGACTANSCYSGYEKFDSLCAQITAPIAKINIFILRNNNGTGNELWDDSFVKDVVRMLTKLSLGSVKFVLNQNNDILNNGDYQNLTQLRVGPKYVHLKEFGYITALISNPGTTDFAGNSLISKYTYEPFFIMRARERSTRDQRVTIAAQVFLHELGHNLGMTHNYEQKVHMDNYYYMTPDILINYVNGLNDCVSGSKYCQNHFSKFPDYYNKIFHQ